MQQFKLGPEGWIGVYQIEQSRVQAERCVNMERPERAHLRSIKELGLCMLGVEGKVKGEKSIGVRTVWVPPWELDNEQSVRICKQNCGRIHSVSGSSQSILEAERQLGGSGERPAKAPWGLAQGKGGGRIRETWKSSTSEVRMNKDLILGFAIFLTQMGTNN